MAKTYGDVSKAAMQTLGPKGKLPPEVSTYVSRAATQSHKSLAEFVAARKALKEALEANKDDSATHLTALQAQVDDVNKDNLGLEPKDNPNNPKKIAAARKLLVEYFNQAVQYDEKVINGMKKLDAAVKIIMDAE
jgi:hypothetical protein